MRVSKTAFTRYAPLFTPLQPSLRLNRPLPTTSRRDYPLTSPSRALGPLVIVTSVIGSTDSMSSLRDDSIKIPRCNKSNPPIVAILVALAQEQRQANRRQGTEIVTAEKATTAGKSDVKAASSQFRASTMTSLPSPPEATERRPQETASSFKVCHSVGATCYRLS
jgi:hypothetical protein